MPKLVDLPDELRLSIANRLTKPDVRSLCRTSKECRAGALDRLATLHVEELHIVLVRKDSINRALWFLDHPFFGPRVGGIVIFLDEIAPDDRMLSWFHRQVHHGMQLRNEQYSLLMRIFNKAHKLGQVDEVTIKTGYDEIFRTEGHPAARQVMGYEHPHFDCAGGYRKVFQALAYSSLRPHKIDMAVTQETFYSLPLHSVMQAGFYSDFMRVLQGLTSLELDVWVSFDEDRTEDSFFALVAAAPNLKHLGIKSRDDSDGMFDGFDRFTFTVDGAVAQAVLGQRFQALESIHLLNLTANMRDVDSFAVQNPNVQQIKFSRVILPVNWYGDQTLADQTGQAVVTVLS